MAAGVIAVAISDQWSDGHRMHVTGTITPADHYVQAGVVVNFATAGVRSSQPPVWVSFPSFDGYSLVYVAGDGPATGVVHGYSASNTELTDDSNWPAGLKDQAIPFYAIFPQF